MKRSPANWTRSRRSTTLSLKSSSMPFGNSCRRQPPDVVRSAFAHEPAGTTWGGAAATRRRLACYSPRMRSVADLLRAEERAALATVTPGERVALALALGARGLEAFCFAHEPPLAPAEATRVLERRRQQSRRPSRCIAELIG